MLNPVVQTQDGLVTLTYLELPEFELRMDFNSIVNKFNLRGKFCLLHWQAKPFGERRWGVYDGGSDSYTSLKFCELSISPLPCILLQVNETIVKTVPTAVVCYPNSKLIKDGYYSLVPA